MQGAAGPLQRAGGQLLRRDRRGVRSRPGPDRSGGRVEPRHATRIRDGRAAAAPARRRREHALGRRAPSRGAVPVAALRARPAAAGRAHEPSRRRVGRVAGAAPVRVQGCDRGGHARPLLPGQRRRLDPRARSRQGHPLRGQLLGLARAEADAHGSRRALGKGTRAHDRRGARMGQDEPEGQTDEVQGAPGALRGADRRGAQRQARRGADPHSAGPAPGREGARGRGPAQGLRGKAADRGPQLRSSPRGHRRRDRRQRRRQDDPLPNDHRRGVPRRRLDHAR